MTHRTYGVAPGEWNRPQLSMHNLAILADEVWRQGDGPEHVYYMSEGWYQLDNDPGYGDPPSRITVERLEALAGTVEPKTQGKVRVVPVQIGGDIRDVPTRRGLELLCEAWNSITPAEWYYEYEMMHPFVDGNGRTGLLWYNYLRGTLDCMEITPWFWEGSMLRRKDPLGNLNE